jgi:hypothetical protein
LDETFAAEVCGEDNSLFKAQGRVWRQSDREQGRIPDGLRNLDEEQECLRARRTMLKPVFDLVSQVAGTPNNHKQLPHRVKGLARVSTFLLLSMFLVQVAMIVNDVWGLPLHNISHLMAVFT